MVEDEYLAEIFERAAGESPSASDALAQVRPRIRRAHRRRAAMRGSAALVVLVVLGGVISKTTTQPSQHVQVGDAGTTAAIESTSTPVAPSTTLAPPQAPQNAPDALVTTVESGGVGGGNKAAAAPEATSASASPAPSPQSGAKPAAAAKPPASTPATSSPASAQSSTPPPQVTSIDGQAGSIEVQYTDTSMILHSVSPLPGWSVADTESDGASIHVTFEQESGDSNPVDIAVHLGDDGRPEVDNGATTADVSGLTGS